MSYQSSRWKIAQYNLTLPIPNALMNNVARQIGDYHKMKKQTNSTTSTAMMMTANNDNNYTFTSLYVQNNNPQQSQQHNIYHIMVA